MQSGSGAFHCDCMPVCIKCITPTLPDSMIRLLSCDHDSVVRHASQMSVNTACPSRTTASTPVRCVIGDGGADVSVVELKLPLSPDPRHCLFVLPRRPFLAHCGMADPHQRVPPQRSNPSWKVPAKGYSMPIINGRFLEATCKRCRIVVFLCGRTYYCRLVDTIAIRILFELLSPHHMDAMSLFCYHGRVQQYCPSTVSE